MTNLSVNINKIATLRNARGENVPNVEQVAIDCESFGANGITVHPRPDERHIRHDDVFALRPLVKTEFNIEGYPSGESRSKSETRTSDPCTRCSRCNNVKRRMERKGKHGIPDRHSRSPS